MTQNCHLVEDATQELVAWAQDVRAKSASEFDAAQQLVRRLGAHRRDDAYAEIGFWTPELFEQNIDPRSIYLEILHPPPDLDLDAEQQTLTFKRERVKLVRDGDYLWGVVAGMVAGLPDWIGDFYWLVYQDAEGNWQTAHDHLAYSVPYGVRAPAEYYNMAALQKERPDKDHFANLNTEPDPDGTPRIGPPANILQIHPNTASAEGSLAGLTRIYNTIAEKIRTGADLTPAEKNYIGYDAVQLMPVEPPIEHEGGPLFWQPAEEDGFWEEVNPAAPGPLTVTVHRHDITNWGYDVMISASPAPNPSVLGSRRPHELMEFIAALHNFPEKPIMAMFDIVYGHTDNQAIGLLNHHYLAGSNMYGQNMNYLNPVVRAILIEMQRRKSDYGIDGIRVDGAQDFKWWDSEKDEMIHDDDYLQLMNDIVQDVAGAQYRPWMIFEDGRPWPRDDWELASTYREVTKRMPNVWQWGPLTFAHNTPFLFTFWVMKWWRIQEMATVGREWITGCANHDTLRRGTQVPIDSRINTYLGESLPEIFQNAYDNPAAKLFDYGMMPGIPMDFINASMRAPWGFIRNTDDKFGVKVVSEEARFLDWTMTEERFNQPDTFPRLKKLGFTKLAELKRFMRVLDHMVQATDYNLVAMAAQLREMTPPLYGPEFSVPTLKQIARAWMDDVHDYCNVSHYAADVDPKRASYNLKLREFRRDRPWLMENLRDDEYFDYLRPADGSVLFYGLRRAPDKSEELLFVANMEGAPRTVAPLTLPVPGLAEDGWQVAIATPNLYVDTISHVLTLEDSQGVLFVRVL